MAVAKFVLDSNMSFVIFHQKIINMILKWSTGTNRTELCKCFRGEYDHGAEEMEIKHCQELRELRKAEGIMGKYFPCDGTQAIHLAAERGYSKSVTD